MKKAAGKNRKLKETVKGIDFTTPDVVVGKYAQRDPAIPKTRITLYLDNDVLAYFKSRAAGRHAAPYQTQINNELRAVMERDTTGRAAPYEALVNDEAFIAAVAAKLATRSKEQARK
jgi:uncharacterized protein (DUF4415 family)